MVERLASLGTPRTAYGSSGIGDAMSDGKDVGAMLVVGVEKV